MIDILVGPFRSPELQVLSSTLREEALPRLTEGDLSSYEGIEGEDGLLRLLPSFVSGMTMAEEYEYHVRFVSNAIQSARNMDVAIDTQTLSPIIRELFLEFRINRNFFAINIL